MRYAPRFLVVSARDVVVHVQSQSTPDGSSECHWTDLKEREPERKGIVRMPLLRGSWTIEPLDATRSRVVYQVAVNPGGRLPGWLVRRGAVSALPDVIEQVRRRLERESRARRTSAIELRRDSAAGCRALHYRAAVIRVITSVTEVYEQTV